MLLIATDEAGYGPKLGPLVIAASRWRVPGDKLSGDELGDLFTPLRQPTVINGVRVVIDDSKAIFQSGREHPLAQLHAAVSACNHWWGWRGAELSALLSTIAATDCASIDAAPWLRQLSGEAFLPQQATADAVVAWSDTAVQCESVRCRIVTAKAFNAACEQGANKADLLSETTLALVRQMTEDSAEEIAAIDIYCDRHGGRRYYAGVLQHVFADATVSVLAESKQQSSYRIVSPRLLATIRFTVKGDSFTPVAMSSIYAKYLRERLMQSLNEYFAGQHQGEQPLKPTAGYPADANRFLTQIEPILTRNKTCLSDLVRQR
jgi:ribonuclease HII